MAVRKLKTLDDVEDCLAELTKLDAAESKLDKECADKVGELTQRYASRKVLAVDDGPEVTFADRRAELAALIEAYASQNRADLLEPSVKSVKLRNGKIGWEKAKDTIVPIEGETEESVVSGLTNKLTRVVIAAIEAVRFITGLPSLSVVSYKIGLNKAGILKAIEQKQIKPTAVAKIKMQFIKGQDQFFVRPNKPVLDSHSESVA